MLVGGDGHDDGHEESGADRCHGVGDRSSDRDPTTDAHPCFISTHHLRISGIVQVVAITTPPDLGDLYEWVVPTLRAVYDLNAERHDPSVGDDAVTFGQNIYRNSWYQLEQSFSALADWKTGRPDNSLVLERGRERFHVYRCGNDEGADLRYRLDDSQASCTKVAIARSNSRQLVMAFDGALEVDDAGDNDSDETFDEYVIIHAGNPDDGCCGIWVGAPLAHVLPGATPWAWIEPLWLIERAAQLTTTAGGEGPERHTDLATPNLHLELTDPAAAGEPELHLELNDDEGGADEGDVGRP